MSETLTRRAMMASVAGITGYVTYVAYGETKKQAREFSARCDEAHGEGNWVLVSANDSEWDSTYLGDQHVCVHEDSNRAVEASK